MKVFGHWDKVRGAFHVEGIVCPNPYPNQYSMYDILEVHFPPGSRNPQAGDRLAIWTDVSTPYAVAPRG